MDCDAELSTRLLKHLKMYKLRRKIDLEILSDYATWAIFNTDNSINEEVSSADLEKEFQELKIPLDTTDTFCTIDPRVKTLGFRLLAPKSNDKLSDQLNALEGPESFANLRHRLGVAEGADEVESGEALPLEFNADYAHGVSFHKGCYIGQELTARTHHTGVIRKRVMPLEFCQKLVGDCRSLPEPASFVNEKGKTVGKFISGNQTHGIGLMRIQECTEGDAGKIRVKDHEPELTVNVDKPFWWPKISPKKKHDPFM